ncbi:hypothetical protein QL285_004426 [Trifolium repens]|nr:hypothetical protein QL285_004426 [Trifolium repens]
MSNLSNRSNSNQSCKQDSRVDSYESTLLSPVGLNNLNSIISSFSPSVAINFSLEPKTEGSRTSEYEKKPFFVLQDLWDSFKEWSVYGVEVPLTLNNIEKPVSQYFVPYLSALQLYVKDEGLDGSSAEENATFETTKAKVAYQYIEFQLPYERQSFINKISTLAMENPCIKNYRSSDLLPCSWFSVAWYPIYRIPSGSTLKNLEVSFLTFHNLSTGFIGENQSELLSGPMKMSLPIFGLSTYKLKGSILTFPKASESPQLNSLLKGADVWLQNLKVPVYHHDHSHFTKNGKQWI